MKNNNKRRDPNDLQSREAVIDRLKIGGLTVLLMTICVCVAMRATTMRPMLSCLVAGILYFMTMTTLMFENHEKKSDDDDDDKHDGSGKR